MLDMVLFHEHGVSNTMFPPSFLTESIPARAGSTVLMRNGDMSSCHTCGRGSRPASRLAFGLPWLGLESLLLLVEDLGSHTRYWKQTDSWVAGGRGLG